MISFGCANGWISMALPLLRSDATPLATGILSISELSWIASVISLGALTGNCLFGFIVTIFGTRHTIFSIGFPQLVRDGHDSQSLPINWPLYFFSIDFQVSWLFLIFGRYPVHLAISRFLSGFVLGGAQMCIFLYLAEIADNE